MLMPVFPDVHAPSTTTPLSIHVGKTRTIAPTMNQVMTSRDIPHCLIRLQPPHVGLCCLRSGSVYNVNSLTLELTL